MISYFSTPLPFKRLLKHLLHLHISLFFAIELYRITINNCLIAVGVENPHKFWMLDKLVDRFPLSPVAHSLMYEAAAHSTTSLTPTAMGQSFIMTL
jgi:hypothetical protein